MKLKDRLHLKGLNLNIPTSIGIKMSPTKHGFTISGKRIDYEKDLILTNLI